MREPEGRGSPDNWPTPYDPNFAAPMRETLTNILETAIAWARS
jgi:formiminoglutamase